MAGPRAGGRSRGSPGGTSHVAGCPSSSRLSRWGWTPPQGPSAGAGRSQRRLGARQAHQRAEPVARQRGLQRAGVFKGASGAEACVSHLKTDEVCTFRPCLRTTESPCEGKPGTVAARVRVGSGGGRPSLRGSRFRAAKWSRARPARAGVRIQGGGEAGCPPGSGSQSSPPGGSTGRPPPGLRAASPPCGAPCSHAGPSRKGLPRPTNPFSAFKAQFKGHALCERLVRVRLGMGGSGLTSAVEDRPSGAVRR